MRRLIQLIRNSKINKKLLVVRRSFFGELYSFENPWIFFFNQVKNGKFNRYDVVVRYLAVQATMEENRTGLDLYLKMQQIRDPNNIGGDYLGNFRKLIDSIKLNGFDFKQPIICNQKNELIDGSHRLACALYFDVDKIRIKRSEVMDCEYGLQWFSEHFTESELAMVESKFQSLIRKTRSEKNVNLG